MDLIKDNIYWAGYTDWDLRNFHGYSTPYGTTYNAYLINDEKPTLIDTVKDYGVDEMIARIKEVIDPAKIKYVVSNHTEMDHSGSIGRVLEYCPDAEVVCSPKGEEGLKKHFIKNGSRAARDWNFRVVDTGDELDIGKRKLKFLLMPMVHWPDSMATFSETDRILFPNDAFGQHMASSQRYADEVGMDIVCNEAAKYYGNIVLPYGKQVLNVLEQVSSFDIDMICPSHGLIWRGKDDITRILRLYKRWASNQTENRVVIIYDSMWHSTESMAKHLYGKFCKENIPVKLINLKTSDISDVVTEVLYSKFALFGSPILNNRMLPTMAGLLMYLKGLKSKERYAATFGSYGWSTVGFKELEESVKDAGFDLLLEGTYVNFVPDNDKLEELDKIALCVKDKIAFCAEDKAETVMN